MPEKPTTFERYGAIWSLGTDALTVEMGCIRMGGKWKGKNGQDCGLGMAHHFEQTRHIIWPYLDGEHNGQRWHILTRDKMLENKISVLLGSGGTGKTHSAAWLYLCDYWCHPENTILMISSTDVRGLELRVWGEIKKLFELGKERFPRLSGYLIDSKHAISTDEIEEEMVRDLRKGVIGIPCVQGGKQVGLSKYVGIHQQRVRLIADECFPAGTMVDTPNGPARIESIRPGDFVLNVAGACRVQATLKKQSQSLVKIVSRDGREIICTPNHPIFTQNGWKCACNLSQLDYMLSANESMSILQGRIPTHFKRGGVPEMQGKAHEQEVQTMQFPVQGHAPELRLQILQSELLVEMASEFPRIPKEVLHQGANQKNPAFAHSHVQETPRKAGGHEAPHCEGDGELHELAHTGPKNSPPGTHEPHSEKDGAQTKNQGRKRNWSNQGGTYFIETIPDWNGLQLPCKNRNASRKWLSTGLQAGRGISSFESGSGGRWQFSQFDFQKGSGFEKDRIAHGAWVDSCEVYEPENYGGHGERPSGNTVYNLEIELHPSYSVNGFLVHNCQFMQSAFLSAFANFNQNPDFRASLLGNPNDPVDPLGRAAEPEDGWMSHMQPDKTSVWATKFMSGVCVNLIGTDSPNFDFPQDQKPRFPYLPHKRQIEQTRKTWGDDSYEYHQQCVGSMKTGTLNRRVLTRDMARQFRAQDDVVWKGTQLTRICGLDAAYGGDRCVCGHADFGEDVDGKILISFNEPRIVPIKIATNKSPEDQIAEWVKTYCESHNIPPENFFHDSTGRGSLGTALARVWSAQTNPVEFGGKPTDRPVTLDHFIWDAETHQRRLLLCAEYYYNFVTELWFSIRFAVESSQIRNLPESMLDELCLREWDKDKGRIQVEPKSSSGKPGAKPGMKQRTGKSPDQGDAASIILEGARRRGFNISRLASEEAESVNLEWLETMRRGQQRLKDRVTLNYSA